MKLAANSIQEFSLLAFAKNPNVIFAILCFGLQSIFWQIALKKHNLSYAYYFMSLRYLITVAIGYFIFSEFVSLVHLCGLVIIIIGIMIFVRKEKRVA